VGHSPIEWKSYSQSMEVKLTPETTALLLSLARNEQRQMDYLKRDLFGPNLVDQYGRPLPM
jgi:hypothetical protein